jgi:hypothetical protein
MASMIELLGSQQAVDEAKKAAQDVVEVAIAHALGAIELDEDTKLLPPVKRMIGQAVDENLPKIRKMLDQFVDDTLLKLDGISLSTRPKTK